MNLRPMTLADAPLIAALDRTVFSLPWSERGYLHEAANPDALCRVAEVPAGDGMAIAGWVVAWVILDELHIATIAVLEPYRRMGIARRMLAGVLLEGMQRGCTASTLEVRASNLAAQVLYTRFGYAEVGRRLRYYQDNREDAILMTVAALDEVLLHQLAAGDPLSQPGGGV